MILMVERGVGRDDAFCRRSVNGKTISVTRTERKAMVLVDGKNAPILGAGSFGRARRGTNVDRPSPSGGAADTRGCK